MKFIAVIASLISLISVQSGQQEQCSVDRLPVFGDVGYASRRSPDRDRFQAIVPAYRFQCSGRVTEWGACVFPGGRSYEEYYIQFQVWRPTGGTEGCYELVGYNEPPPVDVGEEQEEDTGGERGDPRRNTADVTLSPVNRCVVLTVDENEQIDFQPGDVVGYYVDHFRNGQDKNNGGIQWINGSDVVVYYRDDLPKEDIRSQYALNGPNPTDCGFQIPDGTSTLHILSESRPSAPIISLSIGLTGLASMPTAPVMTSPPTAPSLTPSPSATGCSTSCTTAPSNTVNDAQDVTSNNTNRNVPIIIAAAVSILIVIIGTITIVAISVLLWLRKMRKRDPEVVENVAYSANLELNAAYHTVNTTSAVRNKNVESNEGSTSAAYETVQPPSRNSVDIRAGGPRPAGQ